MNSYLPYEIQAIIYEFVEGGKPLMRLSLAHRNLYPFIKSLSSKKHDDFEKRRIQSLLRDGWGETTYTQLTQLTWKSWSQRKQMLIKVVVYDSPYTYCPKAQMMALDMLKFLEDHKHPTLNALDRVAKITDLNITSDVWRDLFWLGPPPKDIFSTTPLANMHVEFAESRIYGGALITLKDESDCYVATIEACTPPSLGITIQQINKKLEGLPMLRLRNASAIMSIPPWIFSIWYRIIDKPQTTKAS